MSNLLAPDTQKILDDARQIALDRHSVYVDIDHLALALLQNHDAEPLRGALAEIDRDELTRQIALDMGMVREAPLESNRGLTRAVDSLLNDAASQAATLSQNAINGGHVLLALFNVNMQPLHGAIRDAGLEFDAVQAYVKANSPAVARGAGTPKKVMVQFESPRQKRREARQKTQPTRQDDLTWVYILITIVAAVVFLGIFVDGGLVSFGFVIAAWIFSLTLHEFSHAIVAYWGGDHTVRDKGYLTFNPLKYTHPLMSVGLPLLFLALGGIGLPGGAVFIETHRLRSKQWRTAVSLAGPASNMVMAVVFAAPFWLGLIELGNLQEYAIAFNSGDIGRFEAALAFTVLLQITAVLLNMLPIPPLDGFNAISPYLPPDIVRQVYSFGIMWIFVLFFVVFNVPAFNEAFWGTAYDLTESLGISRYLAGDGLDFFRFWVND